MIVCPHCYAEQEAFEVSTVHTLTGARYVAECEECEKTFEIDITVRNPAA